MDRYSLNRYLLLLLVLVSYNLKSQNIGEYVIENSKTIDLTGSPFEQLSNLDSTVANCKFFFFGDGHMFNSDVLIQWFFLEYLYTKANVRNYIIERGPAESYAINKYVIDGDSTYLQYTTDYHLRLSSRNNFYRAVHELNKTKLNKDKIKFFSFDSDVINNTALLQLLIKNRDHRPESIMPMLDKIINASVNIKDRENFIELLEELAADIQKSYTEYEGFFEEDFYIIERIASNPNNRNRSDAKIFDEFVSHYDEGLFQYGNFLCTYGFGHTVLNNSKVIGGMINDFFNQEVITFLPYYINSYGKYGPKENFYKSWGASITGKSNYKNNKFAKEASKISKVPIRLIDLRFLPNSLTNKKELAGQFLIIFTESEAIH